MKISPEKKLTLAFILQAVQLVWMVPFLWRFNASAEMIAALSPAMNTLTLLSCVVVAFGLPVGIMGLWLRGKAIAGEAKGPLVPLVLVMSGVNLLAGMFQTYVAMTNLMFSL